jgi:hypothetical protein
LEAATVSSKKPLNNGNLSPGLQTYLERRNELSIDNTAAFRTIRRIPPPTGEAAVRLGNAYEFFKNLELLSGYWIDTSLPSTAQGDPGDSSPEDPTEEPPTHLRTHHRTGSGAQLPPEFRQHLITAFIKLVAYDFGCNVSLARVEPRLHLTPPKTTNFPPSYFNSSAQFVYRTPRDRAMARMGIVEGPLAAVSCRASTVFLSESESKLDLAREVVAVLLTAQQRAREGKEEKRFGEGKWWTRDPRWGGGPGGAIGKEIDKTPLTDGTVPSRHEASSESDIIAPALAAASTAISHEASTASQVAPNTLTNAASLAGQKARERSARIHGEVKRAVGGMKSSVYSPPSKKSKRGTKEGNLAIYENYRKMLPPGRNWDHKARYEAIGKMKGTGYDDVFLVSALNHHVSVVRARVPDTLLGVLGGEVVDERGWEQWGRLLMWRSRWFDLFLKEERIEAMGLVWGMMSWLMRAVDDSAGTAGGDREIKPAEKKLESSHKDDDSDRMDTS